MRSRLVITALAAAAACHSSPRPPQPAPMQSAPTESAPTLARIYYWRAHPGNVDEYTRYIRDLAEPIDHEAQRRGAFVSITTTVATDSASPWTHMRVFLLRDSAQLAGLSRALDEAGVTLEPDSVARRRRGEYSATLRDRAGDATVELVNGKLAYVPPPGFAAASVKEGWIRGDGGVRLFYRLVGSGSDTIVYVHGGPGTGMREGYDLERITTLGHALLMYDQRGSGMSELVHDTAQLGLARHAADLDAVLAAFHLARPKLIGLSWGAAVVAAWAARHPDVPSRLVFLSPISPAQSFLMARFAHVDPINGRPNAGGLAGRLAEAAKPVPDSLVAARCRADRANNYAYRGAGPQAVRPRGDPCDYPTAVLRNRVAVRAAELQLLGNYDFRPMLARVRAPSIVVEGERTNVPLDATQAFADAIPRARLLLVPGAGHQNWLDRPDLVYPMLDEFFRRP